MPQKDNRSMVIVIQKCCTKTIGQFPSAAKRLKFNSEVECTNCTTSKQPPATVTSFIAKSKCKFLILVSCFHVECHWIVVSAEMTLPCHPALNTPQYSMLNTPTPFHTCTFLIAPCSEKAIYCTVWHSCTLLHELAGTYSEEAVFTRIGPESSRLKLLQVIVGGGAICPVYCIV